MDDSIQCMDWGKKISLFDEYASKETSGIFQEKLRSLAQEMYSLASLFNMISLLPQHKDKSHLKDPGYVNIAKSLQRHYLLELNYVCETSIRELLNEYDKTFGEILGTVAKEYEDIAPECDALYTILVLRNSSHNGYVLQAKRIKFDLPARRAIGKFQCDLVADVPVSIDQAGFVDAYETIWDFAGKIEKTLKGN